MIFLGCHDSEFESKLKLYHEDFSQILLTAYPDLKTLFNFDEVKVELTNRMTNCLGKALLRKRLIKLSYPLLRKYPEELRPTYGHELAHIIAGVLHDKNVGHKQEWKDIMANLNLSDERCHSLDNSEFKRKVKEHIYFCSCPNKEIKVSTIIHHRIIKRKYRYNCKTCKQELTKKSFLESRIKDTK